MRDLNLLPNELRLKSLSNEEIVLTFADALKAIDIISAAGWASIAWEGWIAYPDKTHGHINDYQGTVQIDQKENETWDEYIKRAAQFLKDTIIEDNQRWLKDPRSKDHILYFCITILPNAQQFK